MSLRRTVCPPGPRPASLDAQPSGTTFYALRSSLGDEWTKGAQSEWFTDSGCLHVRGGNIDNAGPKR